MLALTAYPTSAQGWSWQHNDWSSWWTRHSSGDTDTSTGGTSTKPERGWTNQSFASQDGEFTIRFDATPGSDSADLVAGISSESADAYSDLAALVRFNEQGRLDARDGNSYRADATMRYQGGTTYQVRMEVDTAAHTYSVYAAPEGGAETALATDYSFRNDQAKASELSNLASNGDGAQTVKNLAVETPEDTSSGTSGGDTSTPVPPASEEWSNTPIAQQTGEFSATFDASPSMNNGDIVTGLSGAPADSYDDLATIVRFNTEGTIDVRDGGTYRADTSLAYAAGNEYHFRLQVNTEAHTYSVFATPQGGTEVRLATDYAFRSEQGSVSSLSNLASFGGGNGTLSVTGISVTAISGSDPVADEPVDTVQDTAWPDASNTGVPAGVTLRKTGSMTLSTPGAVVSGVDVDGTVTITADNVTLRNCKVHSGAYDVIIVKPGVTGAVIENCEVDNLGSGGQGIAGQGTFRRNNIHGAADGIDVRGDNTLIEDNYIHGMSGSSDSHFDSIQADGGFSHLTIRHNTIINENNQTSAVMLDNYWGPIDDVVVDNNRLIGGGYTAYLDEVAGQGGTVTNVRFTNNRLGRGYWGYLDVRSELGHTPIISGNVDDSTGELLDL